ncbi:MAG: serine hydrolase [Gemmatales bacterium]
MKSFSEGLGKMRYLRIFAVMLLMNIAGPAHAQSTGNHPEALLKKAATLIQNMLEEFLPEHDQWFTQHFYSGVPKEKLLQTLKGIRQQLGPVARSRICKVIDASSGELEFVGSNGNRLRAVIRMEPQAPHGCTYLLFSNVDEGQDTWPQLSADLMRLPGEKAASVHLIAPQKSRRFVFRQTDPLAVGSSFKLLVLNQLADEISSGTRKWADTVSLQQEGRSLPSGILQDWPVGSPVTLHTLAGLMITRSDNTAADHLMLTLGRESLEQQQARCKVLYPERNCPFLRTSELFKIKLISPEHVCTNYPLRSEDAKRTLLKQLEKTPLSQPRIYTKPVAIDQVEWFYTTDDLCQMMERLKVSNEWPRVQPLLSIVKPFDIDDYAWEYLGFKGGAEVGVLNLTLLGKLRGKDEWYTVSFTWNRTDEPIDEPGWIRIVQRAMLLIERGK